ncbi:response regulator, partial [Mycobacterium tuberculosis]|nr:response regulator [Mycobacterium tuberculosis]
LDPGVNLLSKPYGREVLARRLRALLGPAPPERPPAPAVAPPAPAADPLIGRSILLCEDDVFIRMDTAEILRGFGCIVVEAGDSPGALDQLAATPVDLLITDVGLPGTSGVELAAEARRRRAALPVVFASGQAVLPEADGVPGAVVLTKPFGERQLRQAVARGVGAMP